MRIRNTDQHWGGAAQAFHWLIALLIVAQAALGWYMTTLKLSPTKFELFALHKSLGITVLTLALLRLLWRLSNPTPALPAHMTRTERWLAHGSHTALYLLLFAMPVSGYVINSATNFPLEYFGLFPIPNLTPESDSLKNAAAEVHETLVWILVAVLALHVAGALKHHFVDRDDVLQRMLPRLKRRTLP